MNGRLLSQLSVSACAIICILPLVGITLLSFTTAIPGHPWEVQGLTFERYTGLMVFPRAWEALFQSAELAVPVGLLSATVAFTCALAWWSKLARWTLFPILFASAFVPGDLYALGFGALERVVGLQTTPPAMLVTCLTIYCLPFATIVILAGMSAIPVSVLNAARDLGANRLYLFWEIVFRIVFPSFVSSALVSVLLTFNEYDRETFLSGGRETYTQFTAGQFAAGVDPRTYSLAALSLVSAGLIWVIIVLGWNWTTRSIRRRDGAISGAAGSRSWIV